MSDPGREKASRLEGEEEPATGSVNLTLVYSLLGAALLAAILFACFIVFPFYIRR